MTTQNLTAERWTRGQLVHLSRNYATMDVEKFAESAGKTVCAVYTKANSLGLRRVNSKVSGKGRSSNPLGLSDLEVDIIRSMAAGRTTEGIAADLEMNTHTVRDRLREIRKRMGAHFAHVVVLKAERMGLLAGVEV